MKEIYLKDIIHEYHKEDPIWKWNFKTLKGDECRIYYKVHEGEGLGFSFYAVEHTGNILNDKTKNNQWHQDYCMVECVFNGIAYFDGIRRLYYGDSQTDNFGYHYCANLSIISHAIFLLSELEDEYCSQR